MITEKDVEEMAALARLELTTQEKEKLQKDLESVLIFIDKLKKLKVDGVEPTTAGTEAANVMRSDEVRFEQDNQAVEQMLAQAPDRQDNFVKVKSILKK